MARYNRNFLMGGNDTRKDIAERIRRRENLAQAEREAREVYPDITPENFAEALAWRERRIAELNNTGD